MKEGLSQLQTDLTVKRFSLTEDATESNASEGLMREIVELQRQVDNKESEVKGKRERLEHIRNPQTDQNMVERKKREVERAKATLTAIFDYRMF